MMKQGHHLPKDKRPAMAKRAVEISRGAKSMNAAIALVEDEFDVSTPTARNLISYGHYLADKGKS